MKIYNNFESFIKEAIKAGEESEVYIDDYTLDSGDTIKATEILGAIESTSTEKEFKQYFFDQYGEGSFIDGELDDLTKFFNDVKAEERDKDNQDGAEASDDSGDGSEESDTDLDIDL